VGGGGGAWHSGGVTQETVTRGWRDGAPGIVAALASPLFVLAGVWGVARVVTRLAPGAFPVVAVGGLLLWLGSIYLVGRTIHALLWRGRATDATPWGKFLLTGLFTALWFGVVAQGLALAFPTYFQRPPGN
jgi:hypothetical protein